MSNPTATAATDYEQMQDPLHSKPHYQKQPSSFGVDSEVFDELEEEVYIVKQSYGYLAILFSLAQTVILIIMMARCGVAPINVNPMVGPYPGELFWNDSIWRKKLFHIVYVKILTKTSNLTWALSYSQQQTHCQNGVARMPSTFWTMVNFGDC